MTELSPELQLIGSRLQHAYASRLRRRRFARTFAALGALAAVSTVTALAATGDLQLDPTKWQILGSGSVDDSRGEYVHAKNLQDGGHSTFMVEHDAGMDRYEAFLLHERLKAEADSTSPVRVATEGGTLCTRDELATVEQEALDALRANASPEAATAGTSCRGVAYGVEIAGRVFSGIEPASNLMPGVR
jgi:hypothetical protein